MDKGEVTIPVIPVLLALILIGGLGFYILTGSGSPSSEHIEAVKNTESFEELEQEGEVQVRSYNITQEDVSFSQRSDFPYNWSSSDLEDRRSVFTMAVDFTGFDQVESTLVFANNSRSAYIYQLENGDVTNTVSGLELISEVNEKETGLAKRKACRASEITVEETSVQGEQLSVNVSNRGGKMARWVYINVTADGEKFKEDDVIDGNQSHEFSFEDIETEKVEQIDLNSDKCGYSETINQLPVE